MKAYRYISLHIKRDGFAAMVTSGNSDKMRHYDNVSVSSAQRIAELKRRGPGSDLVIFDDGSARIAVYSA